MPNYTWNVIKADAKVIKSLLDEKGDFSFNNFIPMPEELRYTTSGGYVNELIGLYLINTLPFKEFKTEFKKCVKYGWYEEYFISKERACAYFEERLHGRTEDIIKDGYGEDAKEICRVTGKDYYEMHLKYGCHDWYDWANKYWGTKWDAFDVDISENEIRFTTAWCAPEPIFNEICKRFSDADIEFESEYEDNLLTLGRNSDGYYYEYDSFEKHYPEDFDWDNGDEDVPWISNTDGHEYIA